MAARHRHSGARDDRHHVLRLGSRRGRRPAALTAGGRSGPERRAHGPLVVREATELALRAASWLADAIQGAIAMRGSCAIGLSGGQTPRPVYLELASPRSRPRVSWPQVHVFFSDERAVPPDDPDSNYRMAREALLAHVPIPPAQVHRMEAERADRAAAAADYERVLPQPLDVLLLGIGTDGHTASLFPGSPALLEWARRVVPARGPKPPLDRLTITPPVITAARRLATIVTGEEKASQVARVLRGPFSPEEVPAQLARHGTWFLDRAAALLLSPPLRPEQ